MRTFGVAGIVVLITATVYGCSRNGADVHTPKNHPVITRVVEGSPLASENLFTYTQMTAELAKDGWFKPRPDNKAWQAVKPIDWNADPFLDRNWRFQLQSLRIVDPLLISYEETGDIEALTEAKLIAADWLSQHQDIVPTNDNSMAWYDMAVGLRAMRLAFIYNATRTEGVLDSHEAEPYRSGLLKHVDVLSDPSFFNPGNHGIFIAHGLMAICRTIPDARNCPTARGYARDKIIDLIFTQYNTDGGHVEHSPGYHGFVLVSLNRVVGTEWYDLDDQVIQTLDAANNAAVWMSDATGRYPNIGDSERKPNIASDADAHNAQYCTTADGFNQKNCYEFKQFPVTGYVILRTSASVRADKKTSLFATCSRFSGSHKHDDELSFEWLWQGTYVLVDSGKYSYNGDAMQEYMQSRPAHNTAFVPGETVPDTVKGGCFDSSSYEDGILEVAGRTEIASGVHQDRQIIYDINGRLAVVDNITQADAKQDFEIRWNFGPEITARKHDNLWKLFREGKYLVSVRVDPKCRWSVDRGTVADRPEIGWYSETYGEVEPINVLRGRCRSDVEAVATEFLAQSSPNF